MRWRWSSARLTWESPRRWASPTGGHTSSGPSGAVASWVVPAYPRRWSRCICLERTVHLIIVQTGWLATDYRWNGWRIIRVSHQWLSGRPAARCLPHQSWPSCCTVPEYCCIPGRCPSSPPPPWALAGEKGGGERVSWGEGRGGWWWMDGRRRWEWS